LNHPVDIDIDALLARFDDNVSRFLEKEGVVSTSTSIPITLHDLSHNEPWLDELWRSKLIYPANEARGLLDADKTYRFVAELFELYAAGFEQPCWSLDCRWSNKGVKHGGWPQPDGESKRILMRELEDAGRATGSDMEL
jgi:hypothetical protein